MLPARVEPRAARAVDLATEPAAPSPQPAHAGFHWRIWGAEAVATALLVLGALSSVALVLGDGSPVRESVASESVRLLLTGLLVGGCVSLIVISPLGRLSGAHLNPAVTLAFRIVGRVSGHDVFGYLVAQLAGALAGALVFRLLWGSVALSVDGGVTHPSEATAAAIGIEAGMTGLLVGMIFVFLSRERLMRWTPLMLWPLLGVLVWQGSPYTGTSLNPARSTGPAVAFTDFADLWLYLLAPILGAVVVAALWQQRHPESQPMTAKLFHDPRYPSSLRCELPAMPPDASLSRG
jgi:aquaporin Z